MLSLFGLEAVLEYLEANKRIHITARTPSLRKKEKSIPLHVKNIRISERFVKINNISYDILNCSFKHRNEANEKTRRVTSEIFSPGLFNYRMRQMTKCLLGERPETHVNDLQIFLNGDYGENLLENILFHPKRLDGNSRFIPIVIHPLSSPLLELRIPIYRDSSNFFRLQHVKSSEKLTIFKSTYTVADWFWPSLRAFHHPNVILEEFPFRTEVVLDIIQKWQEQGREVGTKLRYENVLTRVLEPLLDRITAVHSVNVSDFPLFIKGENDTGISVRYSTNSRNDEKVDIEIEAKKLFNSNFLLFS